MATSATSDFVDVRDIEANQRAGTMSSTSSDCSIGSDNCLPNTANLTTYKPERLMVLGLGIFAILSMVSNLFVLSIIHDIVGHEALPDIVFSFVPQSIWVWKIADPMLSTLIVMVNIMTFLHRYRWIVWRRYLFCLGVMYSLRALTLTSTQLPSSFVNNTALCKPFYTPYNFSIIFNRFFNQILIGGMQAGDDRKLCGALMFSGHTIQFTICALMLTKYTKRDWHIFRIVIWIVSYTGMVFMVISRSHYTIDVLIAYWLTVLVFTYYHAFTELPVDFRPYSIVKKLWINYPIKFLEKNTPAGLIPNEIEWPLNRPKMLVKLFAKINSFRFKNAHKANVAHVPKIPTISGITNQNYQNDENAVDYQRQIQLSNI